MPPSSFLHKPPERKPSTNTSSLLWAAAHQHSCEEKHKMRDQRTGRCLLRQTCCDTLALTVSSARDFVLYFLWETKLIPSKHQFLWADWLQLYSDKSLLKTAQLGGLHPVFLHGFWLNWRELHKSGHTHKAICSLRYWCTYLCSAVIWNIWLACWRNSWVLLIFQTSKYSCWTVKQPWGVWLTL